MITTMKLNGVAAHDLIYPEHLAKLPETAQENMQRTMRNSSHVWLASQGTDLIAVYGLIAPTLLSDRAYLWLYTTKHMPTCSRSFIRQSQRAMQEMLQLYPTIVGHGVVGSTHSLRWLRWLGAEFADPDPDFMIQLLPFTIKSKAQSWPQDLARSA